MKIYEKPRARSPIVHGNTVYEPDRYLLSVADKPVRLTANELRLLTCLLDRFAKTVRKPIVLDEMYGHRPAPPHPMALNVTMCRLRRKLTDAGADLALRSVRGRGIVLELT